MGQHHSSSTGVRADGVGSRSDGKIRAAHLLVKHRDSRRPSSWKENTITRSKDDAMGLIEGYEKRIQNKETSLGNLAVTESDCSSARKRGDLYANPWLERSKMLKLIAFVQGVLCKR